MHARARERLVCVIVLIELSHTKHIHTRTHTQKTCGGRTTSARANARPLLRFAFLCLCVCSFWRICTAFVHSPPAAGVKRPRIQWKQRVLRLLYDGSVCTCVLMRFHSARALVLDAFFVSSSSRVYAYFFATFLFVCMCIQKPFRSHLRAEAHVRLYVVCCG